jgi:hypothetical protein
MKLKWEHKAFAVAGAGALALLFVSVQWQDYQERIAKEERAARLAALSKPPTAPPKPVPPSLAERFKADRPAMMATMKDALITKKFETSLPFGEDFKSVSDKEFDALWGKIVLASAAVESKRAESSPDIGVSRAVNGARMIKKSAHDPASVTFDTAAVVSGTNVVCYVYRARNGFGAMRRGQALIPPDGKKIRTDSDEGFQALWNRECAGKTIATDAAALIGMSL